MILLSDEISTWGNIATVHYTHRPRSVIMQISLAGRMDFTQTAPGDPILRAVAFFTSFVAGGVTTDLTAAPLYGVAQFRADAMTEASGEVFAENTGTQAIVNQFCRLAAPVTGDTVDAAVATTMVAFINRHNGTIAYKHLVKVIDGGRVVSEQEAVDTGRRNAAKFSIDTSTLDLHVTQNANVASRAKSFDTTKGTFVNAPLI